MCALICNNSSNYHNNSYERSSNFQPVILSSNYNSSVSVPSSYSSVSVPSSYNYSSVSVPSSYSSSSVSVPSRYSSSQITQRRNYNRKNNTNFNSYQPINQPVYLNTTNYNNNQILIQQKKEVEDQKTYNNYKTMFKDLEIKFLEKFKNDNENYQEEHYQEEYYQEEYNQYEKYDEQEEHQEENKEETPEKELTEEEKEEIEKLYKELLKNREVLYSIRLKISQLSSCLKWFDKMMIENKQKLEKIRRTNQDLNDTLQKLEKQKEDSVSLNYKLYGLRTLQVAHLGICYANPWFIPISLAGRYLLNKI
jgi:hypothetical protein